MEDEDFSPSSLKKNGSIPYLLLAVSIESLDCVLLINQFLILTQ